MKIKNIYATTCISLSLVFFTSISTSADVEILQSVADAEKDVAYLGLRLKTYVTSNGSRTLEEIVVHNTAENSFYKVESVLGQHKPSENENNAENQDKDNDRNRDDRRRRQREFRWERQRSQFTTKEIKLVAQNYELKHTRWGEKIAGHETDILIIKPKFPGRPSKHIYFARKNGVILKVQDFDAEGIFRRMFVYTRISFDPKVVQKRWETVKKEINNNPRKDRTITLAEAEKVLKKKPIQPKFIPQGFQLQNIQKHQYRDSHPIQFKYTDGMLEFNIIEVTGDTPRRDRPAPVIKIANTDVHKFHRGPTTAFGWSSADIRFLLIGTLPSSEMQKVVESIIQVANQK